MENSMKGIFTIIPAIMENAKCLIIKVRPNYWFKRRCVAWYGAWLRSYFEHFEKQSKWRIA